MTKPLIIDMTQRGNEIDFFEVDSKKVNLLNVVLPSGNELITTEDGFNEIEKSIGSNQKDYLIQCGILEDSLRIPLSILSRIGLKKDDRAMITINDDKTITIKKF